MRIGTIAAVFLAGVVSGVLVAVQAQQSSGQPAERVTGIGGVFLKAREPKALSGWYRDTLGLGVMESATFAPFLWREREDSSRLGTTVWSLFPSDTKYFAPSDATCMVNYRVRNLEAMLAQFYLGVVYQSNWYPRRLQLLKRIAYKIKRRMQRYRKK